MSNAETRSKLIAAARKVKGAAAAHLTRICLDQGEIWVNLMDQHQWACYDLAWIAAEIEAAQAIHDYAVKSGGELEAGLADFFTADLSSDISSRVGVRLSEFGIKHELMEETLWNPELGRWVEEVLSPKSIAKVAKKINEVGHGGHYGLSDEHSMIRDSFKKFAEEKVAGLAEKVHRHDELIPETIIQELAEMGCFGLSVPQKFGGFQDDAAPDNMGMVAVTEELSRGSLGIAGSLITRPEILAKALLKGGTEEQKQKWLPVIASGQKMVSVCVTEPDFGSDVAGMKVTATRADGGWRLNGVKTWATFAGRGEVMLVLARTDPDMAKKHRGLSILIAEKPPFDGHAFDYTAPNNGGRVEGKAIPTIGYRGMHSFEVAFHNYFVPAENLIGGEAGLGKGFYLQMEGFAGGRLQTAARANGVMQAAFEAALRYSTERKVFGTPVGDYQLTQYKLVRMAALVQAARQFTYHVARLFNEHQGQMEGSLVKFFVSRIAEWVAREAMQIHGGYGYAEEYPVSRYYVDARVFSIFEGAEEVLALRVIARQLLDEQLKKGKN